MISIFIYLILPVEEHTYSAPEAVKGFFHLTKGSQDIGMDSQLVESRVLV